MDIAPLTRWVRLKYTAVFFSLCAFLFLLPVASSVFSEEVMTWVGRVFVVIIFMGASALTGKYRIFLGALGVLILGSSLTVLGVHGSNMVGPLYWLIALFMVFGVITWVTVRNIISTKVVRADTVMGALIGFLLLGICFAALHSILAYVSPGSIKGLVILPEKPMQHVSFYYSFVTLTTLGYGDIVPISPAARALAYLEALFGQVYIAVFVARFVGIEVAQTLQSSRSNEK